MARSSSGPVGGRTRRSATRAGRKAGKRSVRPPGPPRAPVVAFAAGPEDGNLWDDGHGRHSPLVAGASTGYPAGAGAAAARRRGFGSTAGRSPRDGFGRTGNPHGGQAWAEKVPPPPSPGRLEPIENAPVARFVPAVASLCAVVSCSAHARGVVRRAGNFRPSCATCCRTTWGGCARTSTSRCTRRPVASRCLMPRCRRCASSIRS